MMQRIVSIHAEENQKKTHIRVIADGEIPQFTTKTLHSPNRIVIDLICHSDSFETAVWPVRTDHCKEIRAGHHNEMIRVVLDIKGDGLPVYRTMAKENELLIVLDLAMESHPTPTSPDGVRDDEEKSAPPPFGLPDVSPPPPASENAGEEDRVLWNKDTTAAEGHGPGWAEDYLLESLLDVDREERGRDAAAFMRGTHAFRIRNWRWAIQEFDQIIKDNSSGRYIEKASFLRAMAYDRLYSDALPKNLKQVAGAYKDAINRHPASQYLNHIQLALGNLYQRAEKYYEALGYYNLIYKLDERSVPALKALIQKAKILNDNNRKNEALAILRHVIAGFPMYPEIAEAKIELAKMLYERNKFHQSLKLLLDLNEMEHHLYRYPEILRYLGYNHYQLGEFQKARHHLIRFYNIRPDDEGNHLLLSQIGDSHREEGRLRDAAKFYQLVIRRYPDTEGAVISRIRLAEQLEKGDIVTSIMIGNREISSPRIVYEDIMKHYHGREEKSPLKELTLLKLALLHYKKEDYKKSFDALKELLNSYPKTGLIREAKHTLERTIKAIFQEEIAMESYSKIIKIYHKEEDLFSMLDSPELLMMIARAAVRLDLMDLGMEMFKKADPLIPQHEKPEDLLFYTGKRLFEEGGLNPALKQFNLLTTRYPNSHYARDAYLCKGDIFMQLKQYEKAAEVFSHALKGQMEACHRLKLLITKAGALNRAKKGEQALRALKEAHRIRGDCDHENHRLYREMGDLYLQFGYAKAALDFFLQLLSTEKESAAQIPIKFKVAQCYGLLNKEKDSLELYDQIAGLNEPFWSDLAKEKMNQFRFNKEITSMESQ
jgi:tetratricopeptide (TPR) repeat protein